MKVISKSKEYIAIKIDYNEQFFINLGKYLSDDCYEIVNERYRSVEVYLIDGEEKKRLQIGDYLLVDGDYITYVDETRFENDYVCIKEEK